MTSPTETHVEAAELTLTDFLLARIAEDEVAARAATPAPWTHQRPHGWTCEGSGSDMCEHLIYGPPWGRDQPREITPGGGEHGDYGLTHADAELITSHNPARVLAECEAKRRIIQAREDQCEKDDPYVWIAGDVLLKILAAVYADHPDYRDEWRP